MTNSFIDKMELSFDEGPSDVAETINVSIQYGGIKHEVPVAVLPKDVLNNVPGLRKAAEDFADIAFTLMKKDATDKLKKQSNLSMSEKH